jgi:hypothetical protein
MESTNRNKGITSNPNGLQDIIKEFVRFEHLTGVIEEFFFFSLLLLLLPMARQP